MKNNFKTLTLAAIAALSLNQANAINTKWTWTGATNNLWNTKSNWNTNDENATINNGDTVIINADLSTYPALSNNVEMASLELNGGNINLNGRSLTVYGITKFQGGTFVNPVPPTAVVTLRGFIVNFTGSISIGSNISIDVTNNSAVFTSGVILNANPVIFRDNVSASVTGNSYIDGPVTKIGNDAFTFPTGDNGFAAPISISAPLNALYSFTAQYFNNGHANQTAGTGIDHISEVEYWTLVKNNGGSQSVNVSLSYSTVRSGIIEDLSEIVVAQLGASDWSSLGGIATGNNNNGVVASTSTASNFNAFTLASTSSLNPLPIKLLSFTAAESNKNVEVKWVTISEDNNDFFTVEKSLDGKNWMEIGIVEAAGNSVEMVEYAFTDRNANAGVQYYRLKQTDNNGAFTYTSTVVVNLNKTAIASVYPNPSAGNVNISLSSENGSDIRIINASGQVVMLLNNQFGVVNIDLTELPTGIYSVEVVSETESSNTKLVRK